MKIYSYVIALALMFPIAFLSAHSDDIDEHLQSAKDKRTLDSFQIDKTIYQAFQLKSAIDVPALKVPSVVVLPVTARTDAQFAVESAKGGVTKFEPFKLDFVPLPPRNSTATVGAVAAPALTDSDEKTTTNFPVQDGSKTTSRIDIFLDQSTASSSVSGIAFDFAQHSARPEGVSLTSGESDGTVVYLRTESPYTSDEIRFPESAPIRHLTVHVVHTQPLRIAGIRLFPDAPTMELRGIRFLAQPGLKYTLYSNPDRLVYVPTGEVPALSGGKVVLATISGGAQKNPSYKPSDVDGDNVLDAVDNCQTIANTDQADIDQNGVGDSCDDFDRDGIVNTRDNCPSEPNGLQVDVDGDKKGDACDTEESRLTEKYTWIPWVAIGFVALVIAALSYSMLLSRKNTNPPQSVV